MSAAVKASQRLANLDGTEAHAVKQTFFIGAGISSRHRHEESGGPFNDLYIDITSVVERKIRVMDQFMSQGYEGDFARKCVAGHDGHWRSIVGVVFAEPFSRSAAETHALLPLADLHRDRDEVTLHRQYSRGANVWNIPVEPSPTTRFLRGHRQ